MMGAAALVAGAALYGETHAQTSGANVGTLTCNVAGGVGFVFGSSKELSCLFNRSNGTAERYTGEIKKFGVDIGFYGNGVMVWAVIAPTSDVGPGALSGDYGGVSADVAAGLGVGANALVGGGHKSIALQPVSIEGVQGLNIAAGVGVLNLRAVH